MVVSEFIEWLSTQDQGATVEILRGGRGGYEGDRYWRAEFDPKQHADYTDMRGNPYMVGRPTENARYLFLGGD